jgi:hypothetical protein
MPHSRPRLALGLAGLVAILLSIVMLERDRAGLVLTELTVGRTPATLYALPEATGPVVVIAHGFAGSRQIMQAYSLPLARAGFRVLAFDFEGHGRNPVPMSGDVTSVDGTTALLVAETRAVIAAARALPGAPQIALLGHSMATDILVRASLAEAAEGRPVAAIVGISMFSGAVTATDPARLLMISGQWEAGLRRAALDALHLVDPAAVEGSVASAGPVTRAAVVAPMVEHVGVLFSPTAVRAAQDWLAGSFAGAGPTADAPPPGHRGLWVLALLGGIVIAARPLIRALPRVAPPAEIPARRFWLALLVPAVAVPLVVAPLYRNVLPVLVADYLMLHLAACGLLQLALLGGRRVLSGPGIMTAVQPLAVLGLAVWGILIFGLALDRYAASFWPTPERLPVILLLCLGTVPFMLADSVLTGAGRGALWRRAVARLMLVVSLGIGAAIRPEELGFVLIVLPVLLLFYAVHGLVGRWVAQRAGAVPAGLGLGLCLAWALGVSFPLFA